MNPTKSSIWAITVAIWLPAKLVAQPFDSGSNGSYGPMNITSNTTLNLPPDGIFRRVFESMTSEGV